MRYTGQVKVSAPYSDALAQAIALAPDCVRAVALWDAGGEHSPTVEAVLGQALLSGNREVMAACKAKLGEGSLDGNAQGRALAPWRRSPTNRDIPVEEEAARVRAVIALGLIDGRARVPIKDNLAIGPVSWMIAHFRFDGADAFLAETALEQEDLDQALYLVLERLRGNTGSETIRWIKVVERLLDLGADPEGRAVEVRTNGSRITHQAGGQVLTNACRWRLLDREHAQTLIGAKAIRTWTGDGTDDGLGRCPMIQWVRSGGDLTLAFDLAADRGLDHAVLGNLIGALLVREGTDLDNGGERTPLHRRKLLEHLRRPDLDIPALAEHQMVEIVGRMLAVPLALHDSSSGFNLDLFSEWWRRRSRIVAELMPVEEAGVARALLTRAGVLMVQLMEAAGLKGERRNEHTTERVQAVGTTIKEQLPHLMETLRLEAATAPALGMRSGPRL